MKNFTVIQMQLIHLKARQKEREDVHGKLNQIDMLSGEGNMIRQEINQTKGMIKALEWVTNDNIDEL